MSKFRNQLLTTTVFCGAVMMFQGVAYAREAPADTAAADAGQAEAPPVASDAAPPPAADADDATGADDRGEEIVVTGTIFRRTNTETPSPVTVLSTEALADRGITNVADAVRSISADNSGSVPNAFSIGFGAGAQAPSLRGLTVNSTLTLVDGQRVVNYPLADDGQRSFVDLNTMPRVSIERIEVLKDGASSTYGADAIGGVVNIIQRKQFNGFDATVEAGTSQHGGGDQLRASALAGWGDYEGKGVNFYVGAEYESNAKIYARDRGFPFNTNDLSSIDGGLDLNWNLLGLGGTGTPAIVRRATQLIPGNLLSGVALPSSQGGGIYTMLNPAQCTSEGGTIVTGAGGSQACQQNPLELYGEIQPKTERFGLVGHGQFRLGDNAEAYVTLSWYRNNLTAGGAPQVLRTSNPVITSGFVLPNYICADGIDCDNDPLRQLNPYNPYAAAGPNPETRAAQLFYRFTEADPNAHFHNEVLRGAAGVSGTFADDWNYRVDASASVSRLRLFGEAVSLSGFSQAIATGSYNLFNPQANSQAVRDQVIVDYDYTASAGLYMAQGTLTREVAQLPGGPLQLGVGVHFRHESLDNPNGNPTGDLIGFNQANARGERNVSAAFFEVSAPVLEQLELQLSGRYDHYSTGFSAFSPKVGFKFTPIKQLALRGTFSKGFRAPSFAETSGEITGFTGFNHSNYQVVCTQHGGTWDGDSCSGQSSYGGTTSVGFRNNANPDLDPERSRSFTVGAVFQPLPWLSFTVDYYNIKKTDIITGGPLSNAAIDAYYAGTAMPDGYSVILNPADPQFPDGIRTVAIVVGPYANASSLKTSGLDMSLAANVKIAPDVRFLSNLEVTDIFKYDFRSCTDDDNPACDTQRFVGTQGPYIISSGAGTPKWRANWSNSLEFGPAKLTATAYYVSGYHNTAEDISGAGTYKNCATAGDLYNDERLCKTKKFIWVDAVASYDVTDQITAYVNVLNLLDAKAPLNPPNYAAANYNPTYTQSGAVGRFFRVGANFKF